MGERFLGEGGGGKELGLGCHCAMDGKGIKNAELVGGQSDCRDRCGLSPRIRGMLNVRLLTSVREPAEALLRRFKPCVVFHVQMGNLDEDWLIPTILLKYLLMLFVQALLFNKASFKYSLNRLQESQKLQSLPCSSHI